MLCVVLCALVARAACRDAGGMSVEGSTLTFNIHDGEFDDQFFDPATFEPMIEILVNEWSLVILIVSYIYLIKIFFCYGFGI